MLIPVGMRNKHCPQQFGEGWQEEYLSQVPGVNDRALEGESGVCY